MISNQHQQYSPILKPLYFVKNKLLQDSFMRMNKTNLQIIKMNKVSSIPLQKSLPGLFKLNLSETQQLKTLEDTKIPSPVNYKIRINNCNSDRKLKQQNASHNKFYSFKDIRQGKVKQKNNQGKVIMQVKLQNLQRPKTDRVYTEANNQMLNAQALNIRISDLNEARTISSIYSPRQSNFSIQIHQSQIIDRGMCNFDKFFAKNLENQTQIMKKNMGLFLNNSTISHQEQLITPRRDQLSSHNLKKVYNPNTNLMVETTSGWFCHYQLVKHEIKQQIFDVITKIQNKQNILCLYAQKKTVNNKYLLIYEPYEMSFQNFVRNADTLCFEDIIKYLIQLVNQLIVLRDNKLFPHLELNNLVYSGDSLKIKIQKVRPINNKFMNCQTYEKDLLKDIGVIGHDITNKFRTLKGIQKFQKSRKLSFNTLMMNLVMGEESYLQDVYMRLSILKDN